MSELKSSPPEIGAAGDSEEGIPGPEAGSGVGVKGFETQLRSLCGLLEAAVLAKDLSFFYEALRASGLPFLMCEPELDPLRLHRQCCDILHACGGVSPAVALALENHYYVAASFATLPLAADSPLGSRRGELIERIGRERLLVANTNSKVQADKLGSIGTQARREGDGFRVSGTASYMSLATEADLLVFVTLLEGEGPAFFVTPLRGADGIEIGPYLFPNAMVDSDTRRVTFQDSPLAPESLLLSGKNSDVAALFKFELTWHQSLIPALYLGAAARALEEVRRFLRTVQTPDGKALAELDGMVVDVGRLAIAHQSAWSLVRHAGEALAEAIRSSLDESRLAHAFDLAHAAKYVGTNCAEEILAMARRVIGARSFTANHPLERLSQEVLFAPLSGEVHALIERRFGKQALGDLSFLDLPRHRFNMSASTKEA
jgi:alkylation response protein AidB-like acyl-CoA dehydrogenase